jgi:hypothetical protein
MIIKGFLGIGVYNLYMSLQDLEDMERSIDTSKAADVDKTDHHLSPTMEIKFEDLYIEVTDDKNSGMFTVRLIHDGAVQGEQHFNIKNEAKLYIQNILNEFLE